MLRFSSALIVVITVLMAPSFCVAEEGDLLDNLENLDLVNVTAKNTEYDGKAAINLTGSRQERAPDIRGSRPATGQSNQARGGGPGQQRDGNAGTAGGGVAGGAGGGMGVNVESLAIVKGTDFTNGTIEVELAGRPSESAGENARGFIGIAFHVEKSDPIAYDCFYLRPTNGRAEDQLRRNHTCQYMSHPEFTWFKLRDEAPGVYESYVDLAPGEWTQVKIEVEGEKARLFVNGAQHPCLIVNDLKRAGKGGPIALWMEQSTNAYYRNLRISENP